MKDKTVLGVTAMVCIVALEIVNLLTAKIDGILLSTIVGAIAGIGGYMLGRVNK